MLLVPGTRAGPLREGERGRVREEAGGAGGRQIHSQGYQGSHQSWQPPLLDHPHVRHCALKQ